MKENRAGDPKMNAQIFENAFIRSPLNDFFHSFSLISILWTANMSSLMKGIRPKSSGTGPKGYEIKRKMIVKRFFPSSLGTSSSTLISFLLNEVLEHMCPGEGKMSVRELELVDRFHKRKTSAINPAHL